MDSPPLPEDRVREANIFEITGTDLAGPLHLKNGTKVWICIFTCAVYRAIHIETVLSLSTEHFMMAFRRFVARRGRPRLMISDNGTNFKCMQSLLRQVNWDKISAYSTARQIEWRFNPPSAPWWGGFWERLIGILKRLLRKILGKSLLDFEELNTVLCECESMINSRPITYVSEDSTDPVPISPNMFLQEIREEGVPDIDAIEAETLRRRWKYRQKIKEELRGRFRLEYLGQLKQIVTNVKETRVPVVGEVVLVETEGVKRVEWPLATVKKLIAGKDGNCRVAVLKMAEGHLYRPIQRLYPLEVFCTADSPSSSSSFKPTNDGLCEPDQDVQTTPTSDDPCKTIQDEVRTRCGRRVRLPAKLAQ